MENQPKIITVLGVTGSGKTALAIKLAQKFGGEIVSADSRQIYKEFDIGTAKPTGRWMPVVGGKQFMSSGIVHHLVDMVDPKEDFTLVQYKKLALEKLAEINKKNKVPFLVGGTALYLKAVLENWHIPEVEANLALRARLANKKTPEIFQELKTKDPEAALITGAINKRRIIRALEVIYTTGKKFSDQRKTGQPVFKTIKFGFKRSWEETGRRLAQRTAEMIKAGLVDEVHRLQKKYPWSLAPMQSIDYQEFKDYFEGRKNLNETIKLINQHHLAYARRQMTWFKKDKDINWLENEAEAIKLAKDFLEK